MDLLFWDIEMRPMVAYTWTLWPNAIPITNIIETQKTMSWAARWHGTKRTDFSSELDGYDVMLQGIWDRLDKADAVVSWNGAGFDSKHIRREFIQAGMTPPSPWREIDLMKVVKRNFRFASNKLDHVAQELGVGKKTSHTGFQLWLDCMAGDPKAWKLMRKYNIQDVDLLVDLYEYLLPWIDAHPNVAVIDGIDNGCTNCGSVKLQKRGFSYTNTGVFQRYQCQNCARWQKDSHRLRTTTTRSI